MHLDCHRFDHIFSIQVHKGRNCGILCELPLEQLKGLDILTTLLETLDGEEHHQESLLGRACKVLIAILKELADNFVGFSIALVGPTRPVNDFGASPGRIKLATSVE